MKKKVIYYSCVGIVVAAALISIFTIRENGKDIIDMNVEALSGEEDVYGTCCKQKDAICVVGSFHADDYYYKHYGPCND